MSLRPNEILIDDDTDPDLYMEPVVDGEKKGHGLVPRDYSLYPREMFAPPTGIDLIPESEWSDRIKEKIKNKAQLSDILLEKNVPCLNQRSDGYCWAYSVVGTAQADRAVRNMPVVKLSAHMPAAIIKRGRNEGGWCGLSAKFLRENGVCPESMWPEGNRSLSLDTPEVRAAAAKFKITEDWVDLTRDVYSQNLTFKMVATLLLSNIPVAGDFNHWSHSVLLCDLVEVEPGSFGVRLRNSWSESWGDRGFGTLRGSKAITDGAVATRVLSAA